MSERGKKFISIIREGNVVRSLVLRDSLPWEQIREEKHCAVLAHVHTYQSE